MSGQRHWIPSAVIGVIIAALPRGPCGRVLYRMELSVARAEWPEVAPVLFHMGSQTSPGAMMAI